MKRIEEKQVLINDIYNEFIGEFAEDFPLEKIFNPKWNNATYKDKQIKEDVLTIAVNARAAKESIFNTKNGCAKSHFDFSHSRFSNTVVFIIFDLLHLGTSRNYPKLITLPMRFR